MSERVKAFLWPDGENFDNSVFHVVSFVEGTKMEGRVGVDIFLVAPGKHSSIHAHEYSDTLLIALGGKGRVIADGIEYPFEGRMHAIWFAEGVYHGVIAEEEYVLALSVQIPGIKMRGPDGEIKIDLVPLGR